MQCSDLRAPKKNFFKKTLEFRSSLFFIWVYQHLDHLIQSWINIQKGLNRNEHEITSLFSQGDVISKIVGESFEIYCRADQKFNVCIFKWEEENTENCIFIDNVYPWNCPGEMKRIDDKCIIRISSFDSLKHTGENKSRK